MTANIINFSDNEKNSISLNLDYDSKPFVENTNPNRRGDVTNSSKTTSCANSSITIRKLSKDEEDLINPTVNPSIYSSFTDGNDRSKLTKPVNSSKYVLLVAIETTNNQEQNKPLQNIGQIPLNSTSTSL
jgi:hypothetical protein